MTQTEPMAAPTSDDVYVLLALNAESGYLIEVGIFSRQMFRQTHHISAPGVPFPLLDLWGNKNWLPSIKVKKFENVQSERASNGPV